MSIHTTCTVCNKGLDLKDSEKCPICKNYVHIECFDNNNNCCKDCN